MKKTMIVWRRLGKEHGENMEILTSTQTLVDSIRNGYFPPAELEEWHNSEREIVL